MDHQTKIEKRKYINWVRGGLAYKYLKQGLEGFADDVVKQDHKRILSAINYTPGTVCNQCIIERLQPIHVCITNSAGSDECYWGQRKCNCLHSKKKKCRLKVCDFIMEEILKSHGSTPPTPNWTNTDIQKWCTEPWEVAKCFINAPGYSDKTKAADIDISGLLHVFINNINLHSHLACSMAGKNIFIKVLQRRKALFHSPDMEMEEWEMFECIDDVVEILEDPKQLKGRPEAQQAADTLKQLKQSEITTLNEVEVCREVLAYVSLESDKLGQTIKDAKNFICDEQKDVVERLQQAEDKHKEDVKDVGDHFTGRAKETIQKYLHEAVKEFDKHSEVLYERIKKLEADVSVRVEKVERGACSEPVASLSLKSEELKQTLQDAKNSFSDEMKDIVERLQQEADKHKEYIKDFSHQVTDTAKEAIQKSLHEADKHRETLLGRDLCERVAKLETIVFLIMGKQGIVELPLNEKVKHL